MIKFGEAIEYYHIYNATGTLVDQGSCPMTLIDTSTLPEGYHVVKLTLAKDVYSFRFFKQ